MSPPTVIARTSSPATRTLPELLTAQEVADALRVERRTIERWSDSGRLHRVRLGRRTVRYRASEVLALLEASG
jgi:excisionase family DNA binding protein